MHYPLDIIAGAAAGALTGYMVPALHRENDPRIIILPLINPEYSGAGIQFTF
jgi:membrane-associated phospholipid phosphatase